MFSYNVDKTVVFIGVKNEKFDREFCFMYSGTYGGKKILIIDLATENTSSENSIETILYQLNYYKINDLDAVIFYNIENNLKYEFISKIGDPQCLYIDFYKANMTKTELYNKIVTFDKKAFLSSDFYKNNLLILGGTQDPNSTIAFFPKELVHHIISYYSDLHSKDNDAFRFFKSIHSPMRIPDTFSQIVEQKLVENCNIM